MQFELLRMKKALLFCAVLFCLFSSGAVFAAEWSVEPSINFREEYNDNIRFLTTAHTGVWQSRLTPSLRLSSKTEVSEVSGSAQFSINQYSGDPQVENRNDQFYTLLTRLQSERNTWAMNASYKQDSTAESERANTGVVHQTRTQRSLLSLSPSWIRMLTERITFKLDYNYQDVKYDQHINNLNDYTSQQAGGTLQYRLSERDTVSLAAIYSTTEYNPIVSIYPDGFPLFNYGSGTYLQIPGITGNGNDTISRKSSTRSVQVGLNHQFSENFIGYLSLGIRNTITTTGHACNGDFGRISLYTGTFCTGAALHPLIAFADETSGNGSSFNASVEKKFESSKVSGFASRDTNPSGSGLVETDKFGVSLNRSLTEKLTGSFDAIAYRTKYIGVIYPGSRYYTVEPKLNWRFTEWWTLDAGYRYARYEPESTASAITSNAVYLNLAYNWPKMAISR